VSFVDGAMLRFPNSVKETGFSLGSCSVSLLKFDAGAESIILWGQLEKVCYH